MKKHLTLVTIFFTGVVFAPAEERSSADAPLPGFLKRFDTNEDGKIDEEERQAIADLRSKLRSAKLKSIDSNRDGRITPKEIEAARQTLRLKIDERRLQKFREIAGEDDLISKEEFALIPGSENLPDFVFDGIFDRLDSDGSSDISVEEFFDRLRKHQRPTHRTR